MGLLGNVGDFAKVAVGAAVATTPLGLVAGAAGVPLPGIPGIAPGGLAGLAANTALGIAGGASPLDAFGNAVLGGDNLEAAQALAGAAQAAVDPAAALAATPAIDVINGYRWSLNTSPEALALVPRIRIRLLEMQTGQLWQLLSQAINMFTDPYDGIYNLKTVKELTLPFFSNQHHSNSHTWEPLKLETLGDIMGGGGVGTTMSSIGGAIAGGLQLARGVGAALVQPGYKTETPYVWRDTNMESVVVDFNLYNTTMEEYAKNKLLVDQLIFWTLPKKLKATFATPPVLCEYSIPGIRRGLIASVDLTVSTKGQLVSSGSNVPDAYNIQLTLKDLLMQTRNVHGLSGPGDIDSKIDGSTATVVHAGSFATAADLTNALGEKSGAVVDAVKGVVGAIAGADKGAGGQG